MAKLLILIFILTSCGYAQYPHLLVNEKGKVVSYYKVNNVCEFDSVYLKFKK